MTRIAFSTLDRCPGLANRRDTQSLSTMNSGNRVGDLATLEILSDFRRS
jgi:hypothetical protein